MSVHVRVLCTTVVQQARVSCTNIKGYSQFSLGSVDTDTGFTLLPTPVVDLTSPSSLRHVERVAVVRPVQGNHGCLRMRPATLAGVKLAGVIR